MSLHVTEPSQSLKILFKYRYDANRKMWLSKNQNEGQPESVMEMAHALFNSIVECLSASVDISATSVSRHSGCEQRLQVDIVPLDVKELDDH